ncbi:MAG TPA: Uma2 family endonuclease [Pyrinomonadaceae bacterium]|nr:Uma2 family endonuclease [Pyrinomonadaceae bacterium]
MSAKPQKTYTSSEDYLALERESLEKHEYFDGEIFAMAGTSEEHAAISSNINASLNFQLKKRPCKSYQSDLRVHIPATGLYTYPDVMVVCGKPELLEDAYLDALLNPVLIVEVLSPSTADYDKGTKFDHYRTIESLREYVLVWQDKKRVARYTKQDNGSWVLSDFIGEEAEILLSSIDCRLTMEDIYDKVDFKQ